MSTLRISFLFALIFGFVMVGCPEDDPVTDDDDDSAAGDDDDATGDDDDDSAPGDDDDATGDDDDVTGTPDIQVNPPALNFGVVAVGGQANIALDVRNAGDGPLEINVMDSPLTQINFTPFTGSIAPGGVETVSVTAFCTIEEIVVGNLVITSNDPDESPLQIQVSMDCQPAA